MMFVYIANVALVKLASLLTSNQTLGDRTSYATHMRS